MNSIELRVFSSLEKCFPDEPLSVHPEARSFTTLKNQKLAFGVGVCQSGDGVYKDRYSLHLSGALAACAEVRAVECLPNLFPGGRTYSGDYLRTTVGLYPDVLRPMQYPDNSFYLLSELPQMLWVTVDPKGDFAAGEYALELNILQEPSGEIFATREVTVRISDLELPPQKTIHTEWFYTDCIATAHRVKVFSEAHWKLIERYMRIAVESGINMILTPVFTPALDTYIGGERLTTQLLGITVTSDGAYEFDFTLLRRWVALCRRVGVQYYEIPHFFTQWGAKHAPKIMARVNGRKKRIFGWETDSCGDEYRNFLSKLLPVLVDFLEEEGIADHTFFHISDEPHLDQLDQYLRCKEVIEPYLRGYPVIDALSEYAFYESGALKKPAVSTWHIKPFLENCVEGLWAYYCGTGASTVSSRMLAMPLSRTRVLGVQLYLENIEGFLHWGYNYYNNQYSHSALDPFLFSDGEHFAPAGDACLVYPGVGDAVFESLRLNAMREAMEDIRVLQLAEARVGRSAVDALIRELAGMEITFEEYPTDPQFLLTLRERAIALAET